MSQLRFLFPAIFAVLALSAYAAEPHPRLAGTWNPDPAASTHSKTLKATVEPGAPPAPPAASAAIAEHLPPLRIAESDSSITLEFLEDDGSVISTTRLATDGTENRNPRAGGALTHRSTAAWDGAVLRIRWSLERGESVMISGTDAYELTDPGSLRVTTTTEDSKSKSESVIVYRRRMEAK
ncbi:MAG TPA: hypothetical protein VN851_16105 [Thermoanaerobaculia bacterium]|nr:hypothetical protein [Thermoanaerobaculia bacterium]